MLPCDKKLIRLRTDEEPSADLPWTLMCFHEDKCVMRAKLQAQSVLSHGDNPNAVLLFPNYQLDFTNVQNIAIVQNNCNTEKN